MDRGSRAASESAKDSGEVASGEAPDDASDDQPKEYRATLLSTKRSISRHGLSLSLILIVFRFPKVGSLWISDFLSYQ